MSVEKRDSKTSNVKVSKVTHEMAKKLAQEARPRSTIQYVIEESVLAYVREHYPDIYDSKADASQPLHQCQRHAECEFAPICSHAKPHATMSDCFTEKAECPFAHIETICAPVMN